MTTKTTTPNTRDTLTLAAAAFCCAPFSFAHFEPHFQEWRRRNPGTHFPLAVGVHCPTFWDNNFLSDIAGRA